MTYVVRVADMIKNPKSDQFLIIQNQVSLASSRKISTTILLQNHPKISCKIEFNVVNSYYLHRNVQIVGSTSPYEISFYYINSRWIPQLLESFNVPDNSPYCGCCSNEKYKFFNAGFNNSLTLISDKFVNENLLCLLFSVKRKSTPLSKLELKIPNSEMPAQFASLYNDELLTDFKIVCQGQEFLVHKVVLAARCSVFRAMLQLDTKETQENQMKINDFKPEIVEQMIFFLYKDAIDTGLKKEELEKILIIADKYDLENLKVICIKEITKSATGVEEVLEAFALARLYNVANVKETVLKFMKENSHLLSK